MINYFEQLRGWWTLFKYDPITFLFAPFVIIATTLQVLWSVWFPAAPTLGARAVELPSDWITLTLAQFAAWVIGSGLISTVVGYALGWIPDDKYARVKQIVSAVLIAMLTAGGVTLASFIPDQYAQMKVYEVIFALFGSLATSFGGIKLGGMKAETHIALRLDARSAIAAFSKRIVMILVMLGVVALAIAFVAPSASAAGPAQEYHYAMAVVTGISVPELLTMQEQYDAWYGKAYNVNGDGAWTGSYEARANGFAKSFGLQDVLRNGQSALWVRIFAPWGWMYGGAPGKPQPF